MGYSFDTSGRVRLPEALERQALTVLEVEMAGRPGWFDPDQLDRLGESVDTLDDLARFAGSTCLRESDWLLFSTDLDGDPKWSEQATAFYAGLGRFATSGEIHLRGEDGAQWSYRYSPDGVSQVGRNGWDGSLPAAEPPPEVGPPASPTPAGGPTSSSGHPEGWDRDNPFFADRPTPTSRPPGRTLAMAVLLVAGVLLIVALAFLASGI